ncbi:MAG TPA: ABC transporter permease [Gemmatimonadaceae bacterium]|jgi:phospholipid/cholesterol/gamma-HCH transport system permease protein|nr:ABC transporter permease [Gemmatimonadaceae bacterium]
MSLPVQSGDAAPRATREAFLTGEFTVRPPRGLRPGGRFLSRGRVALGSLHWMGWILVSPRSVVSGGVARELDALGVGALRLVCSASILVGLIATFQVAYQLKQYGAESVSALAIGWFGTREVGPLVVALLVVTRSASAIAGEFAAMTAGGEIDALRAMSLDPVKYLVAPKNLALLVALPALTIIADGLITLGGWVGTTMFLGFNTRFYLEQIRTSLSTSDIAIGAVKSVIFAFVIAVIASDEGLGVDRRVAAIGEAASRAVVYCLLGVLAADTLVNAVFYFIPSLVL